MIFKVKLAASQGLNESMFIRNDFRIFSKGNEAVLSVRNEVLVRKWLHFISEQYGTVTCECNLKLALLLFSELITAIHQKKWKMKDVKMMREYNKIILMRNFMMDSKTI